MASVTFYNFSKRKNSTATPSGGTNHTVRLKENTSLYNPTFILSADFPSYTYASWRGLYYYVTDIVSTANGLCEVSCELDPMGSAAGDILSMTAFVNRSDSDYDIWLNDPEMSSKGKIARHVQEVTSLATGNTPIIDTDGTWILRVVGGESDASRGGISTYVCDLNDLNGVLSFLFADSGSGGSWDAAWDGAIKTIFNPFQYIVSLMWSPINYAWLSDGATLDNHINFGWWVAGHSAKRRQATTLHIMAFSVAKPSNYFGDWRDYDPMFTQAYIRLPGGTIREIPSAWLSLSALKMEIIMDVITGNGEYVLKDDTGTLATFAGKLAVPVQIGQDSNDMSSIMSGVLGALGSMQAGSAIGIAGSLTGAVTSIVQPNPSLNGTTSDVASLRVHKDITIFVINRESGASYPAHFGRMLNDNRLLSSLSGFCKCSGAHVDTDLPAQYKDEIDNMLNNGFYIE